MRPPARRLGGRFRAELVVDATGIVVRYDRYWIGAVITIE